ncbi:RING-type E3 ubiquitin transferase [Ranunculus cassubicifolius]
MENEESKSIAKKISFAEVDQLDSDMALALSLEQQDREFTSLLMSESESGDDTASISSDDSFFDDNIEDDSAGFFNDDTSYVNLEELEEEDVSDYQDMEEDDVDPDEMSYEELIALGEIVGAESKGLSENEITSYLHSYSYKRQVNCKDSLDQCVICQFEYEEEEAVVALGCQHAYHSECISKWLQINKVRSCNNNNTTKKWRC